MVTEKQPFISSYAHLPAAMQGEETLPLTVKLLYGEIVGLCRQTGYCWATNAYFAARCRVTKRTVCRWLTLLQRKGYIGLRVEKGKGNRRQIFVDGPSRPSVPAAPAGPLPLTTGASGGIDNPDPSYGQTGAAPGRDTLYSKNYSMNSIGRTCTPVPVKWVRLLPQAEITGRPSGEPAGLEGELPFPPVAAAPPSRKSKAAAFVPPSPEEVRAYMQEKAVQLPAGERERLAERFYNYYQANGWKVGKNAMKDWQAAARNWILNQNEHGHYQQPAPADRRHVSRDKDYHEPL